MPIRIEQDPEDEQRRRQQGDDSQNRRRQEGSGGGGLGGLVQFLPLLLGGLLKRPKLLMIALVIGGIWFFMLGGKQHLFGGDEISEGGGSDLPSEFSFGAALSEEQYDKADVFEPLSTSYGEPGSQLPVSASLLQYAPKRMHQGRQGSCVGWAASYGARSILQARATGQTPDQVAFSPAYLYNQIHLENCQGAYMNDAMTFLHKNGTAPFSKFAYDDRDCDRQPSQTLAQEATQFRIKGYNRLSNGASDYGLDMNGVKQHLAQGAPVVIGMMVGGTFMQDMVGRRMWQPTQRDAQGYGFSGHAMCVIGYDDERQAVQIMNSWGPEWGENGVAWVPYNAFQHFTKEAYGLHPMGNAAKYDPNKLAVKFGLVENTTQTLIPLQAAAGERTFRTRAPMKPGTKFKIAITNSIECYVYVFGQETDGSSYVLFPYTEKHSPYCGITGTRLFPRDHSLFPDNVGKRDYFAIVVSKVELDWNTLNSAINTSRQSTYIGKLREAIGQQEVAGVSFNAPDAVEFSCALNGKNIVGTVIEVDK